MAAHEFALEADRNAALNGAAAIRNRRRGADLADPLSPQDRTAPRRSRMRTEAHPGATLKERMVRCNIVVEGALER
jgi:hypothetical protein